MISIIFGGILAVDAHAAEAFAVALDGTLYYGDIANIKQMHSPDGARWSIGLPSSWFQLNFAEPVEFKAGTYYTLNYGWEFSFANSGYSGPSEWKMAISIDGLGTTEVTVPMASGTYGYFSHPYTFYCDRDFTATYLEIELLDPVDVALPQFTISKTFVYKVMSEAEYLVDQNKDYQDNVQSGLAGIWQSIIDLPGKIGGFFTNLGSQIGGFFTDLANQIGGFFDQLFENIKNLFIPTEDDIVDLQERADYVMEDHFGLVWQGGTLLYDLFDGIFDSAITNTVSFPGISFSMNDQEYTIVPAMDVQIVPDGFEYIFFVVRQVVNIVFTIAFVMMLQDKRDALLRG